MPIPRLLVVGELNADIVVPIPSAPPFADHEQIVSRTDILLGSSSAIVACGAARMSVPTSMVGVLGDDLLGRFLLSELAARQVDTTGCRIDSTVPTGTSTILTLPDGDRSILTALGTIGRVRVSDVPASLLATCAHVHVGSYFLQDALRDDLPGFYRACRSSGISTSLDPNDDPSGQWDAGLADVLPEVDVVFCNQREATAISGRDGVDEACDWFAERMPDAAEVVVKLGARGALVAVCGGRRVVSSYATAPEPLCSGVVDTVGAGDSLAAAYLAARLRELPVHERLRVGVRNGTANTRAAGGTAGQLTWEEAVRPPRRQSVSDTPAELGPG